jgi:hypothetical protein
LYFNAMLNHIFKYDFITFFNKFAYENDFLQKSMILYLFKILLSGVSILYSFSEI